MLNGNHESLNVAGDFRYVTPGAFWESAVAAGMQEADVLVDQQGVLRARWALYRPGGQMARELARNPTVLVVNDIVFAHGGLLRPHLKYGLQRINDEVSAWMCGVAHEDGSSPQPPFPAMGDSNSVMWNRTFGKERVTDCECGGGLKGVWGGRFVAVSVRWGGVGQAVACGRGVRPLLGLEGPGAGGLLSGGRATSRLGRK